ncbi:MAG: hypothetical protein JEZ06_12215 [Anaerolineaceae bacterium]|nr:hypothetical protein [Anaerolineaceae bacterium]
MGADYFGENKDLYGVVSKLNGRIEIRVYPSNQDWRKRIEDHKADASYFLRYKDFEGTNPRAKYWLAKIVN